MSQTVLVLDGVDAICGEILKDRGFNVIDKPKPSTEEFEKLLPEADAIIVRSATKINAETLKKAEKLKVVGRAGVGVDNIDIKEATRSGVLVMNTPDGNTISTAEHTCGLILAMARNIPAAVDSVKAGRWDRKLYMGSEVQGKTLGIIGLGKIGSNVASRMKSFGMNILGYDPFCTEEHARDLGVKLVELSDLLGSSDYLTVHTPLTEKTKGLVSLKNKDQLKKGMFIVNCARGGIYEEADIVTLLDEGVVSGVALDVYSSEPLTDELKEIVKHPGVICTPHLGASTTEAQGKVAEQIAIHIADAMEGKGFAGSLNGKSIALSTNDEVQPFLKTAEKLGQFAVQIAPNYTDEISLSYSGTCARHSEVLTDAFLSGFMDGYTEDVVNLINARFHADARGMKITETATKESRIYSDLIQVTLPEGADYRVISATPFGDNDFRIVDIDDYGIEIHLEGDIVIYRNVDKPGMLAATSSAFANNGLNIAALSLGRKKDSQAITAFTLDGKVDESLRLALEELDGVHTVRSVSL